jgi:2-polyprenyl-3-methyl-5-hydroxy-6-metoxy-1,4-benzoquinol methylase
MSKTHLQHGNTGFIEDQREFFDRLITQDWGTYHDATWDRMRRFEVAQIMRLVPPPRRVLNVGCGCGYQDREFAQWSTTEAVVGIDNSVNSIKQANLHYPHPKVKRLVADIFDYNALIQELGRFDLVVSFQVLEHLTNPQEFLTACASLARAGGYVAVVTPNRRRMLNRVLALCGRQPQLVDPLHFAEYSVTELVHMAHGLRAGSVGLRFHARFGYDISLALKGKTLIGPETPLNRVLTGVFPGLANIIGVIFQTAVA